MCYKMSWRGSKSSNLRYVINEWPLTNMHYKKEKVGCSDGLKKIKSLHMESVFKIQCVSSMTMGLCSLTVVV